MILYVRYEGAPKEDFEWFLGEAEGVPIRSWTKGHLGKDRWFRDNCIILLDEPMYNALEWDTDVSGPLLDLVEGRFLKKGTVSSNWRVMLVWHLTVLRGVEE